MTMIPIIVILLAACLATAEENINQEQKNIKFFGGPDIKTIPNSSVEQFKTKEIMGDFADHSLRLNDSSQDKNKKYNFHFQNSFKYEYISPSTPPSNFNHGRTNEDRHPQPVSSSEEANSFDISGDGEGLFTKIKRIAKQYTLLVAKSLAADRLKFDDLSVEDSLESESSSELLSSSFRNKSSDDVKRLQPGPSLEERDSFEKKISDPENLKTAMDPALERLRPKI